MLLTFLADDGLCGVANRDRDDGGWLPNRIA